MNEYRWCEQCGAKMDYQIWFRANYCQLCGTPLRKETYVWSARQEPQEQRVRVGVSTKLPASAVRQLQATGVLVSNHPIACSLGAIGVGAAGIVLSPLAMAAGQSIMIVGGIVVGVSGYVASKYGGDELTIGMKLGAGILAAGAIVYGSGYVLLGVGGLSVASGIGLGAYAGVKAISRRSRAKRVVAGEPLLLTEGGR